MRTAQGRLGMELRDASLAAQVERWMAKLEGRLASGERFEAERLVVLDGWPFLATADGDVLVLRACDLDVPADAPPRYVDHVDALARWAAEQWEVADALDLVGVMNPPHYLMKLDACPHWERTGEYVMARIPALDPNHSGWALECRAGCHLVASDKTWSTITVTDLAQKRSGLVRFLALPVGSVVYTHLDRPRFAVSQTSTDTNVATLRLSYRELLDLVRDLPEKPGNAYRKRLAEAPPPELDPHRDADVYDAIVPSSGVSIIAERHGVGPEAASVATKCAFTREGQHARVRARFERELAPESMAAIEPLLDDPDEARWRVHNAAGRKLRELTGKPFAEMKLLAERLDAAFREANGRAERAKD